MGKDINGKESIIESSARKMAGFKNARKILDVAEQLANREIDLNVVDFQDNDHTM